MPIPTSAHAFASEFYDVEKSIELVAKFKGQQERFRIDVLASAGGNCSTRAYIEVEVVLTLPLQVPSTGPMRTRVWVTFDLLPWTSRPDADGALVQALGFLEDACDGSP